MRKRRGTTTWPGEVATAYIYLISSEAKRSNGSSDWLVGRSCMLGGACKRL
jgi:hypothetical protein